MRGTYTAMITPFNQDGSVDEKSLRSLVEKQIAGGVHGLVPVGTTGESPTVDHKENIDVVRIVVEQTASRIPVIAGTGSNSTKEAIDMTRKVEDIGASASLQVVPYYNKPSQEGLYRHFITIAEASNIPLVVYNIPSRTGRNMEPETILRLAEHPRITAVKEANGDFGHIMKVIQGAPKDLSLLSGNDETAFLFTMLGGDGVVSVASNIAPRQVSSMINHALEGAPSAREEHFKLLPLFEALFLETNPLPIKYAMAKLGHCQEVYRLPLCPLESTLKEKIDAVLEAVQPS